jgi:class 3 adenylate cyclase
MRRALAVHDERCRTAASRLRAEVFSTTGDGFGIAFHHVDAAVEAAVGLQALLVEISHSFGIALRVRMGLHCGRVERRGDNYFGPVLNRASRLMRRAEGGQVVVSAAVAERLTSTHVRVEPLGSWHLRGIDEPVMAFLATARRRPAMGNLPVLRPAGRPQASTTDRPQQHQQQRATHGAPPRRDQP